MWPHRHRVIEAVNKLDPAGFAELVDLAYELVRAGCEYRRAIRIAVAQARRRHELRAGD